MKFHFCGQLDAPDWILKEVVLLSKLSSIRFKILCNLVINYLINSNNNINNKDRYDQIASIDYEKLQKQTADTGFTQSDIKAVIAAIIYIYNNCSKYNIEENLLKNELQQIGFPKEHSEICSRTYKDNSEKLHASLLSSTLKLTTIKYVSYKCDLVLATSESLYLSTPNISLKFGILFNYNVNQYNHISTAKTGAYSSSNSNRALPGNNTTSSTPHVRENIVCFTMSYKKSQMLLSEMLSVKALLSSLQVD